MSEAERDAALRRLDARTDVGALGDCDLVIEAVFEDLAVKQRLLAELDAVCAPAHDLRVQHLDALDHRDRGRLQAAGPRGRHALLPAGAADEADRDVARAAHLGGDLCGRLGVDRGLRADPGEDAGPAGLHPQRAAGAVQQRRRSARSRPASRAPADIDAAIKVGLGYKMGPLELLDLIGLDTQIRLCEAFYPVTLEPRAACPPLLRRMVAAGLSGAQVRPRLLRLRRQRHVRD